MTISEYYAVRAIADAKEAEFLAECRVSALRVELRDRLTSISPTIAKQVIPYAEPANAP